MTNKITATRRIQFCAGHRVHKHESKCNNLHGHNYVLFAHARSNSYTTLDDLGRVIDFSVIKEKLGSWIDTNWDHGFIYFKKDAEVEIAMSTFVSQKLYIMNDNPTAENMARHLLQDICPTLFNTTGVEIYKITLWETENCFAEVAL